MSLLDANREGIREWTRVGDCYEVTRKPRGLDPSSVAEIPFAAMEAIPQGGAFAPNFTMRAPTTITSGTYFERGDILVAKITPSFENGKQALTLDLPAPFGYATTEVIPLRPKNARQDPRLLFFYLLHPDIRHYVAERMEGSTGRQRVPENVLLDLPMPSFDRAEQTAMADALAAIQRASSIEIHCEETSRDLRRAAMQALFTRGLVDGPVKETAIGPVPEAWGHNQLGDFAEIAYGAQAAVANATDPSIGTLILTNVNLNLEGHIDLEKRRYYRVPEAHRERLSLHKGDVLFNWRSGSANHVGKTVYFDLDGEFTYSSFILRFRSTKFVSNKYLFWWLTHLRVSGFFTSHRNVSSINSVYNASLSATIPVWYPGDNGQREIVSVLDVINRKIDLHRQRRGALESLFKTLLHKMMTGELRVADLDLSALEPKQADEVGA